MNTLKSVIVILALTAIILAPGISVALATEATPPYSEPSAGIVVLDLLLVRPVSAAGALFSTTFCIATMPIAYLIGVGEQSARILVEAPWRFTTGRYLGEFNTYRDGDPIGQVER